MRSTVAAVICDSAYIIFVTIQLQVVYNCIADRLYVICVQSLVIQVCRQAVVLQHARNIYSPSLPLNS